MFDNYDNRLLQVATILVYSDGVPIIMSDLDTFRLVMKFI
jgi:hypothetical protein